MLVSGDMIGQSPPRTGGLIYDRYQPSLSVRQAGRCQIGPKDTLLPGPKNTKGVIGLRQHTPLAYENAIARDDGPRSRL